MPFDRTSGTQPAAAFNPRNRIAQTMMNISNPPPQVDVPPQYAGLGMHMGANLANPLYGTEEAGPSSFMGGRAPPMAPQQQQAPAPAPAPPMPPPMQQAPQAPVDPSTLFAPPPAVPGQPPPIFAKPPVY